MGPAMSVWSFEIARLSQVPAGTSLSVSFADTGIALFHGPKGLWAIEDGCVHCANSLVGGRVDGDVLTCPTCGWQYDLTTGGVVRLPALRLATFPVRVEDAHILIVWDRAPFH